MQGVPVSWKIRQDRDDMIRIVGAIFVLASSSVFGFMKGQQLQERMDALREIQKMFLSILNDISFGQISLPESLERISGQVCDPFSRLLKNVCGEMRWRGGKSMARIWADEVEQCLKKNDLKEKDRDALAQMGQYLGSLDRKTQEQMIRLYLNDLEVSIDEIAKSIQGQQKLYRMLGVSGGLLIILLLL